MPSTDDKLTDIPRIIATRDDDAPRRGRGSEPEPRRPAKTASLKTPGASWRYVAALGLLVSIAATAIAALLYQQTVKLDAALGQATQRIELLEGKLSSTDDSVSQSSTTLQAKMNGIAADVDKKLAASEQKSDQRLGALEGAMKKSAVTFDSHQRRIGGLEGDTQKLEQQVAVATEVATDVATIKQQQAGLQDSIGRLNSTVSTVANTQRAHEARLKESEQWVQSNVEFRKQVQQRLTRLENPPDAISQ
jgi:chromosome segregation ATPase